MLSRLFVPFKIALAGSLVCTTIPLYCLFVYLTALTIIPLEFGVIMTLVGIITPSVLVGIPLWDFLRISVVEIKDWRL